MNAHFIDSESLSGESQISEAIKAIFSTAQLTEIHQALGKKANERNIGEIGYLSEF